MACNHIIFGTDADDALYTWGNGIAHGNIGGYHGAIVHQVTKQGGAYAASTDKVRHV
jgi:hypothetical protein